MCLCCFFQPYQVDTLHITSNNTKIDDRFIGKDLEGSDHILIEILLRYLPGETDRENPQLR
jgi:hypothetical protein